MLDLLVIKVEEPVLVALAHYWNSGLRCFELPSLDMVPTIEEYSLMIRSPVEQKPGPYLYRGSHVNDESIAELVGLRPKQVVYERRGVVPAWKKEFLEDHLESLAQQGRWDYFKKTLALLVFGLVLFPFTVGLIDQAAMDVFYAFENQRISIVPAILAETLVSLKVCQEKKKVTLRCCSHMLYVWAITHLFAAGHMGTLPDPLRDFSRIPVKKWKTEAWKVS